VQATIGKSELRANHILLAETALGNCKGIDIRIPMQVIK